MKKTLILSAALLSLVGFSFAEERTLIDFTKLKADIAVYPQDSSNGEEGSSEEQKPNQNSRTLMDYRRAAGASFSSDQKELMKSSLALTEWEVVLNSSARNVGSLAQSVVKAAPVSGNSKQPFAGEEVMGVRVVFPSGAYNANAKIIPPFSIPAYEPYGELDENGDRKKAESSSEGGENAESSESSGPKWLFEADDPSDKASPAYGLVKNVGTIKAISVTTMGMNFPHALYVLLGDTDGVTRRYFMGYLGFDGWKELRWNNPDYIEYITEVRTREIRIYPIYPRGEPFVKFEGFQIVRDASHIGDDFIGYFKDVKIIYDKANLTSERDIADEDLWGIIGRKENARQALEMSRFGNKQINRYVEKQKMAVEEDFTSSLSEDGDSNAQSNEGQSAQAQ